MEQRAGTMALGKEDWILGGFRALARGGQAAVKVEALARELGATKGSFYWHFKDQAALKEAMLETWKYETTDVVIGSVAKIVSPEKKLEALAERASAPPDESFGGPEVEAAIREWGRYDAAVRERIVKVDDRRIDFTTELFTDLGLTQARTRASLVCAAYVGLLHRGTLSRAASGERLSDFIELLTSQASSRP